MKRGEIWTVSGRGYAGKPRPAVLIQDDSFSATSSITICAFTSDPTEAPLIRILVTPTEQNGLGTPCSLMVDKVTTIPRSRLGRCVGRLEDETMVRLNRAVLVFLGLAGSPRS